MPRARAFDQQEAARTAMQAFWRRGYAATSVEHLVAATGLSRSSIYQTFGSKRGLFDAAIEQYLTRLTSLLAPLEESCAGLSDVTAFFEGWRRRLDGEVDGSLGCLVVNSIAELGASELWIRELGGTYQDRLRRGFIRALTFACDRGEIGASEIGRRADLLLFLTMGLFVAARGEDRETIRARLADVVAEIESWRR